MRVPDNLSGGCRPDLAGLPIDLIQANIRDVGLVNQVMAGVQAVIHLAAHTNVVESVKTPELNLETNVRSGGCRIELQAADPLGQVRPGLDRLEARTRKAGPGLPGWFEPVVFKVNGTRRIF